jgi:hypothetical protein
VAGLRPRPDRPGEGPAGLPVAAPELREPGRRVPAAAGWVRAWVAAEAAGWARAWAVAQAAEVAWVRAWAVEAWAVEAEAGGGAEP